MIGAGDWNGNLLRESGKTNQEDVLPVGRNDRNRASSVISGISRRQSTPQDRQLRRPGGCCGPSATPGQAEAVNR